MLVLVGYVMLCVSLVLLALLVLLGYVMLCCVVLWYVIQMLGEGG